MKKGFFYSRADGQRIPYWVTEAQADRFAAQQKGGKVKEDFTMALPGYGVMEAMNWQFRPVTEAEIGDREQWQTRLADGSLDPDVEGE